MALWVLGPLPAAALGVDDLDPEREWRVEEVIISGNAAFSSAELLAEMLTRRPSGYLPWKGRPAFDAVTFRTDLERLRRFYEARGYYGARLSHDLEVDEGRGLVTARVRVRENQPVVVVEVSVALRSDDFDGREDALAGALPVKVGDRFTEESYQEAQSRLRRYLLERGHAWVRVERAAKVDLGRLEARVRYDVWPGPKAWFGPTRVEGASRVEPGVILRELTYREGEMFSAEKLATSEQRISALGFFRSVRIAPVETQEKSRTVLMRVKVAERPLRDVKLGLGYGTEDQFRGQATWRHRNWFGGGRDLSLLLKFSDITRSIGATFTQPYFPGDRNRAVLDLQQAQDDEETFLLNATRFGPRLEHRFSPTLSAFWGYRLEFAKLNNVAPATIRALGGIEREGIVSGPSAGLSWDATDDPLSPTRGSVLSITADQGGAFWGGDFSFYKVTAEAKSYRRLGPALVLAGRLKIGLADSLGSARKFPLFERFYSGGDRSVRGFGRRRLGPLSSSDDPLGGLSLVEGSMELRRSLTEALGAAVFLDFGQVSTRPVDPPLDNVRFAAGFGFSYATPVGPLRLDVGFPFDPPPGDQAWQVHFSIGQYF